MSITRIGNYSQLRGNPMKIPCIAATTAGITLSGFQTIDGVGVTGGDRVLVKNQSTSSENGIYIVQSGAWYRSADMSSNDDVYEGVLILINQGSTYADQIYYLNTPNPIVLGSTGLTFTILGNNSTGIGVVIDGGGSAITTGVKLDVEVPFSGTITGWTLTSGLTGSIVIDVWKDSYANFPPTAADTITGSEKPTLSSSIKNQDLSLSTWTTAIATGDILRFNVDSASTVTSVTLTIRITKSQ